ncbi:MAG: trypsin-like serine protease [Myxococcota bacterium]
MKRCLRRWLRSGVAVGICAGLGACGGPEASPNGDALRLPLWESSADSQTTGVVAIHARMAGAWFFACTGSLVAPNVVLTAGHCATAWSAQAAADAACDGDQEPIAASADSLLVTLGAVAPRDVAPPHEGVHAVARIALASSSGVSAAGWCGRDIAVLILRDSVAPQIATPLALRLDARPVAGERFDAVGFGPNGQLEPSTGLRTRAQASVTCVGADCNITNQVMPTEWLSNDLAACSGDSGGPALDSSGRIFGVLSRGFSDCSSIVYGAVSHWSAFLCRELEREAADTPPACAEFSPAVAANCAFNLAASGNTNRSVHALGGALIATLLLLRRRRRPA